MMILNQNPFSIAAPCLSLPGEHASEERLPVVPRVRPSGHRHQPDHAAPAASHGRPPEQHQRYDPVSRGARKVPEQVPGEDFFPIRAFGAATFCITTLRIRHVIAKSTVPNHLSVDILYVECSSVECSSAKSHFVERPYAESHCALVDF